MRKVKLTVIAEKTKMICDTVYGFDDVFAVMRKRKTKYRHERQRSLKVINTYFHLKMLAVLEGHKVQFLNGMTIQIVKQMRLRPVVWDNAFFCGKPNQKYAYNPLRAGYQYKFLIQWDELENNGMLFRVAPKYRKMLHKILTTTDKEYPTYEHTATSIN